MIQSKIKQYFTHCNSQIVKRGRELFLSGGVSHVEYEVYQDMGGGLVKGTHKYTVAVHNLFDEEYELETYCDCPYDWDDVCKHQVAVLLALEERFARDVEEAGVQKEGSGELILDSEIFDTYQKSAAINAVTVNTVSIGQSLVEFELEVKTHYWQKDIVPVKISREGNTWRIGNCCKTSFSQVCTHQSAVIYYIKKHWKGFDFFRKLSNLDPEKETALEAYHLPKETDFDNFFSLCFYPKDFVFKYTPADKSFKSKDDLQNLIRAFKTSKDKSNQVAVPHNQNEHMGFALGFVYNSRSRKSTDLSVQIITGKYNRDKTKLVNSFDVYTGYSWVPEKLRVFKEDMTYLLQRESYTGHPESDYNNISAEFVRNIELISSQQCFENDEKYVVMKSALKPMFFQPRPLYITFELELKDDFYHLTSMIRYKDGTIPVTSEMAVVCNHFLRMDREFFIIPDYLTLTTISMLINAPAIIIHQNEKSELLLVLDELSKHHEIKLNDLIPVRQLALNNPAFQVYLSEVHSSLIVKPEIMYENGERFSLMATEYAWSFDAETESGQNVQRNNEAEEQFRDLLADFDPDFTPETHLAYYYKQYDEIQQGQWFFDFFAFCRENKIEVFGLKDLKKLKYSPFTATVNLGISSNIDWFEAHLTVSFGEEIVPLKKLREALERRENFVKLSDGSLGMLPEKWIKKLDAVVRSGEIKNNEIHISKLKFNLIDELFDEINDAEVIREIQEKKQRLKAFSSIDAVKIPVTVKAKLRDYQKEGFYWMNFLDEFGFGGCLADDMGLGKTVQLITFLAHQKKLKRGTSIVVVPKSLLFNWSAEIDKFCPSLKYMHYHGNRTFDETVFSEFDVIITTYNTIANDIQKLKTFHFNYAILDESQAIKNPSSKRYKSACLLRSRNRIVATGTPIENNTFDLYAQFNFLNPGLFGTQKDFKEHYSAEIDGKGDIQRAEELKKIIHPFLLRRTKQQVANDLPEKTEQILTIEMGDEQRKVYEYYLNQFRKYILTKIDQEGIQNSKLYILEGLMKLRQICNSPALIKDSEFESTESAKIDLLIEQLIPLVKTNKVLVFSQFTSMLALIQARLEAEKIQFSYLDGKTNKRLDLVNEFNENESNRVFLISLKAGGTGLNLTSADYVFLVDPWWNPAAEAQAIDRTHRIGQKNHVFAYKMICENSIEEKILKLQEKKKMLSEDLIQAQENFVKGLKKSDIEVLFS